MGDVDGDGDLDLVCGNGVIPGQSNALYLNTGGIFSVLPAWSSGPANFTRSVALGDVDGDGDLDLVCGNDRGQSNTLYLNTGGTFSTQPTWSSGPTNDTQSVALDDVDGDGDLDLVCGNGSSVGQSNTLFLNTGGTFSAQPDWSSGPANSTQSVALGDIDGDGDLDLACGNLGQSNTLYLNAGGTFPALPDWSSSQSATAQSVALGDVDGDGDLDLVCGNRASRNTLYLNTGGTFAAQPNWYSSASNQTFGVALGDIDGDGNLDLVCGNGFAENNTLYLNTGGTFAAQPAWFSGPTNQTLGVALGDVDGDGDLDLACGNNDASSGESNTLYLNMGGTFSMLPAWSSGPANDTQSVTLGDVDSDGDLDLVCGNGSMGGQSNTLYLNTGGTFSAQPAWSSGPTNATGRVSLGDIDGDGDLDLVCGNNGQSNTLYLNTGGVFSAQPNWSSGPANTTFGVALGDVDGDGDLDLVCGNNGRNTLYLNTGGTFSAQPDWSSGPTSVTSSVALGDVDNDGDLDLVCGNTAFSSESNTFYLNTGGTFSAQPDWSSSLTNGTVGVALGDVDGDGDLDLVCGNNGQSNTLYLNTGSIFSSLPAWSSGPKNDTGSVALGDVDGDGDLDLVCANTFFKRSTLYLNTGGLFPAQPAWSPGPANPTFAVALGDVDDDGDLDLAFGNEGQSNTFYEGKKDPVFLGDPLLPTSHLPNNGAHLRFVRLVPDSNTIRIRFTAVDVESSAVDNRADPVWILPEYQFEGVPTWFPAEVGGQTGRMGPFQTSPSGIVDSLDWDISRFPFDNRDVILRLRTIEIPRRVSLMQHIASYQKHVGPIVPSRPELSASVDSLSFPTVTVGDTVSLDLRISNTGNQNLTITDITLPSTEMAINQVPPTTNTPGETDTLTVFLAPRLQLSVSGDLSITSNDPVTPLASFPVSTNILALSVESQLLTPAPEVPLGEAVTVIVTPDPFVNIERGNLISRPADSTLAFSDTIPLFRSGGVFSAVLPGSLVTEVGLHYYIEVENSGVFNTDPPNAPGEFFVQAVEPAASISSAAQPNSGDGFVENRSIRVQVTLPLGAIFKRGGLHFRRGGKEIFQVDTVRAGDPLPFATIPDSLVGARGVEYWVNVETEGQTILTDPRSDPAGNPRSLPIVVSDLVEKNKHAGGHYRLLSIPLALRGTITSSLTDDIGGPDNTRWRLFAHEVGARNYSELPNDSLFVFERGRAYWLITRNRHRIGTGPDLGETTPTDSMYTLTLQPGFNLVGNPFDFPVAWDSMRVDTLAMAAAESTLVQPPVGWIAGKGYQFDVDILEPFDGYWIKNLTASPVVLRIPAVEAQGVQSPPGNEPPVAVVERNTSDTWRIEIGAVSAGERDASNVAGVSDGASTEWDYRDRSEPPMSPGQSLSLYFPHTDWERHPDRYAYDLRGAPEALAREAEALTHAIANVDGLDPNMWGYVWRFDVAKNFSIHTAGDEVVLDFGGIESAPAEAEVLLIDRQLRRLVDLKKDATYRFFQGVREVVQEEDNARFALIVGSDEFVSNRDDLPALPARTVLHQNFPNPFNPTTIIRYEIASAGEVTLRIYNAAGALVKALESSHLAAGIYETRWNGDNAHGQRVASGIYFYKLSAPGFAQTKKMILLK